MKFKTTSILKLKENLQSPPFDTQLIVPGAYTLAGLGLTGEAMVNKVNENSEHIQREYEKLKTIVEQMVNETGWTVGIDRNFYGDVVINRKRYSVTTLVRRQLLELKEDGDYDDELEFDVDQIIRQNIYVVAKRLDMKVTVTKNGDKWIVSKTKPRESHPKHSKRHANVMGMINLWIESLPYCEPSQPPSEIVSLCTDSYFRTAINKSPFNVTYRRGYATKYRVALRSSPTGYVITINPSNPIHVSQPTKELVTLMLQPYGLTLDDLGDLTRDRVIRKFNNEDKK